MERHEVNGEWVEVPDVILHQGGETVELYLAMEPEERTAMRQQLEQADRDLEVERRLRRAAGEDVATVTIDLGS